MNLRKTLIYNTLGLPVYWRACRHARSEMKVQEQRIVYGNDPRQYAMVLTPNTREVRQGHYAFYFHGGAWTFGKPETFIPAALPWLKQGYQVILPSYRRPPAVGLQRIITDCKSAIHHFTQGKQIRDLQFGGISAGAHLAASLALDQQFWAATGVSPSAILCCAGPLDFSILRPRALFLPRYDMLNPMEQLNNFSSVKTRWLLLHGTADATVSIEHSLRFHAKLQKMGQQTKLMVVPDGTHLDSGRWMFGGFGAKTIASFIAPNPAP